MQTLEKPSPQKAARMPRQALVLVDMLERDRPFFSYEHGSVEQGISRTAALIKATRSAGMPLILVTGVRSRIVLPELAQAAGPGAFEVGKSKHSAFSAPDFETILNAHDIDTLIVGGWIRHICVMATVGDALERGYAVRTTDQILFGNRETLNLQARRMSLDFLRRNCLLYDSCEELAAGMGQT